MMRFGNFIICQNSVLGWAGCYQAGGGNPATQLVISWVGVDGGDTGPAAGELGDRNSSVNFDELYKQRSICTYQACASVRHKNPNVSETYFLDYRTIEFVVLSFVFCQISKNLKQSYLRTCLVAQCDLISDKAVATLSILAGLDISQPQHCLAEQRWLTTR